MKKVIFTSCIILLCHLASTAQWQVLGWDSKTILNEDNIDFFQLVDDSSFVVIDSNQQIHKGVISQDLFFREQIIWETKELQLPENYVSTSEINKYSFSGDRSLAYVTNDFNYYILGEKNDSVAIFKTTDLSSWTKLSVFKNDLENPYLYFYPFSEDIFILCNKNHCIQSFDGGLTWGDSVLTNPYSRTFRFYPSGKGFIGDGYFSISFTEDFGLSWKKLNSTDFGLPNAVFYEGYLVDGNIYIVGDSNPFASGRNLVMQLDTINNIVIPINFSLADEPINQVYDGSIIFFDTSNYYIETRSLMRKDAEEMKSNICVFRDNKLYPVFKDFSVDKRVGFTIQFKSYSNDMQSFAYFKNGQIIKYSPEVCSFIEFTDVTQFENGSNTYQSLNFKNYSGEFINYTGSLISTYENDLLKYVALSQTYGSIEAEDSFVQTELVENLNADQYYGVVIDYGVGDKTCFFDYRPSNDIVLGTADEKFNESNFAYPNPTSALIYFEGKAKLLSTTGIVVKEGNSQLDLSELSAGMYLLKTEQGVQSVFKK